jgi:PAS domain S-box-containing protein
MPASNWRWGRLLSLTVAYFLAGKLGLLFATVHASATAIWPPTGIALAALLTFGPSMWPAVAAGAFLVNVTTAGSVATSLGIALGNTAEALIGTWCVRRFAHGRGAFESPRDIFAFAGAVVPGAIVAATSGVTSLVVGGYASPVDAQAIWVTWALGDIAGALIVTPLLLLWTADRRSLRLWTRRGEALALLVTIGGVALAVFGGLAPARYHNYPLAFLVIPPLLWAAGRFGRREAASALLVVAAFAVFGATQGFGPFAALPPTHSLLVLQSFMATMAVMTLVVAALVRSGERETALLQSIIDRIPVMITVYEPNARVLRLNREFERLTGWSSSEARDVDLMEHCYPDPTYRAGARAYMESLSEGWRDFELTTRSGHVIQTSWSNVRLPDDSRIGIGLDVTERKRVEAERERVHAEAEAQSRAKDEFFAVLGHELRNPLGAITTALQVIELCGPGDERSQHARGIVARQVRVLVRLVDDLLDVTRLATGKVSLRCRPVELTAVVRRWIGAISATAPTHLIEYAPGEPVWARADETRLEQIFTNLLNNALKFTPADGRVVVDVEAEGGTAVLRVTDTGAGIPAELQPRIFDLFVQGRTDLARSDAGLGIGLTLAKRLVDLHGGRIEVTSDGPGRGSAFTVRLPIEAPGDHADHTEPVGGSTPARRRFVLVEDNADVRQ